MATFQEVLARFFTSKLIIKREGRGNLKTIDFGKLQSVGNPSMEGRKYKWKNGRKFVGSGYGFGTSATQLQINRQALYTDYEMMDSDAYIGTALDIYADESTVKNEHGDILLIKTDDEEIKKLLYNLFYDVLNIEFNLWHWIRTMCKYGDFFLYLNIEERFGVVDVVPVHPLFIERDEFTPGQELRFIYNGEGGYDAIGKTELLPHEIGHFRHLADQNYLPYGKSLLEGARKVFKQLTLMEDAMMLHRIMRAPERRVFKIDVGGIPPDEIDQYIDDVANMSKKTPYVDETTGEYNLKFNLMNMMEDFYLPTRGGDSGTEIEALPGLSNEGQIEDIEYIRNKMMAFLKIPKAYLGYDSEGEGGKATLAAEDVRFARTIERIQKIFTDELYKIALIHLYVQGVPKEDLINFELSLTNPSLIYQRQQVDLMNEQVNLVSNILEKRLFSKKFIYENIFKLSTDVWKADQERILEDLKRSFREEQIFTEGNDPAITGETYGTPHDLLSLQMASKVGNKEVSRMYEEEDGRHENEGRPEKQGSFERHKDPSYGRDPVGKKYLDQAAHLENIVKTFGKDRAKRTLTETADAPAELKMLDENSILP